MKPTVIVLAFYVFALLLLAGTAYVVFGLKESTWWFLPACAIVIECKPKVTNLLKLKDEK